jgi:hypothetical protein
MGNILSSQNPKVEKFFEEIENAKPESDFEKIPKVLLLKILNYLDLKNISKLFRLNKYFFKSLSNKQSSINQLWKSFTYDQNIEENEIDKILKGISFTPFEKKINKFYLFLKVIW